jgi:hypothetical protein
MMEARKSYQQRVQQMLAAPVAYSAPAGKGLFSPLNHVATAFGRKWTDGKPTGRRGVLVMVRSKGDPEQILPQALVPPHELVKGEKVFFDVIEVGPPRALGYQNSQQPAEFGVSIGLSGGPTGTYGCRVLRKPTDGFPDGQKCILSNNHVMANVSNANVGDAIVQPGDADAWGNQRTVATLLQWTHLSLSSSPNVPSNPNIVDAAIAFTAASQCAAQFQDDQNFPFDPTPLIPYEGMTVIKEGRTTGYTEGTVNGTDADPNNIQYERAGMTLYGYFTNQIQIVGNDGPFSLPGDSGSLVCGLSDDGAYHPIGLLFAGDGSSVTWANPIQDVFDALNIDSIQYNPS